MTVGRITCGALLAGLLVGCGGTGGVVSPTAQSSGGTGSIGNNRPTLAGFPRSTVIAGQTYSFQPTASDPDGDRLTFTAENVPAWLSFDATTGRLSGTPNAADVATYSGLAITVTDGINTSRIGPFSITVAASGNTNAVLSWLPPTQNADGSSLSDLSGYTVLYGGSASDLSESISITNPSVNTFVVENLTPGTWYFAVEAVNSKGTRSARTDIWRKTIG